jgi:hypothetical protein
MAIKKMKTMAIKKPKSAGPGPVPKLKLFQGKPFDNPTTEAEFRANDQWTDRRGRRIGRAVAGLTVGGTLAALSQTPGGQKFIKKTGKAIVGGVKKGVQAIKNIRGTGEYVSNPETGKMERVKKPSAPKTPSARSMRRAEKKSK